VFEKVNKEKIKPGSEKSFGYVFGTFLIILSMYQTNFLSKYFCLIVRASFF